MPGQARGLAQQLDSSSPFASRITDALHLSAAISRSWCGANGSTARPAHPFCSTSLRGGSTLAPRQENLPDHPPFQRSCIGVILVSSDSRVADMRPFCILASGRHIGARLDGRRATVDRI